MPSRKWMAARVTALTGLATLVATSGGWSQEATIMAITLVSAAALAWLLPNESDGKGERGLTLVEVLVVLLIVLMVLILIGSVR
jgi:hypothetical protein